MSDHRSEETKEPAAPLSLSFRIPRYFVQHPQLGFAVMVLTMLAGIVSYAHMPKHKDPHVEARTISATVSWPGAPAALVEELVTQRLEERMAAGDGIERVESTSAVGGAMVSATVRDDMPDSAVAAALDAAAERAREIVDLPMGAGKPEVHRGMGDTAAILLTVTGEAATTGELALRAGLVRDALARARHGKSATGRAAVLFAYPLGESMPKAFRRTIEALGATGGVVDLAMVEGSGFVLVDAATDVATLHRLDAAVRMADQAPDLWPSVVGTDAAALEAELRRAAGDRLGLLAITEAAEKTADRLRRLDAVGTVKVVGGGNPTVFVDYVPARLAGSGLTLERIQQSIAARNVMGGGGSVALGQRDVAVSPVLRMQTASDVARTPVGVDAFGAILHLGDVAEVTRGPDASRGQRSYRRDVAGDAGKRRGRSVTLAIYPKGDSLANLDTQLGAELAAARTWAPEGVRLERATDQAREVKEKTSLFFTSLWESILLVVVVAILGFRNWRTALVLALSILVTLAMTFVLMALLRVDIQQISVASLILSLGLIVDDPVVAGDAIQRELLGGASRERAAWHGPGKLARAIFYGTAANIVAYLPFLLVGGSVGRFLWSLPVVMTASLVASRIVSMTFVPLLGRTFLVPTVGLPRAKQRSIWAVTYERVLSAALRRKSTVLLGSLLVLGLGALGMVRMKSSFFPRDRTNLFVVNVALANDATVRATDGVVERVDALVDEVGESWRARGGKYPVRATTSYVGGGAPRFWYSLVTTNARPNLGQIVVELEDEGATVAFAEELQRVASARVTEARIDVRMLENGKSGTMPVEVRISGDDTRILRNVADKVASALGDVALARGVRDDWGDATLRMGVELDETRAATAAISPGSVARGTADTWRGSLLGMLSEATRAVPIVARSTEGTRSAVGDAAVTAAGDRRVPLATVAKLPMLAEASTIRRRNQQRTITVSCLPVTHALPSEVMDAVRPELRKLAAELGPGYAIEVGGVEEDARKVRGDTWLVAGVSVAAVLAVLLLQFRSASRALLVLAAIPYGVAAALISLWVSGSSLGFMATLGMISLVGVIVSHIVVLFEYLEEARERHVPFTEAVVEACTHRARPVLVTVLATMLGLVPLLAHGGPLWEPLCIAQLGGLAVATCVTLLLVPVLYGRLVELGWIRWTEAPMADVALLTRRMSPQFPRRVTALPSPGRRFGT
ncbi:MAG: efflux RND transporter permease subunit [Polyangiaceae bacterium]|nr:efflux RND transporter permease subunit [Polyangiaceae bacterium]